jgi:hypothetical protein
MADEVPLPAYPDHTAAFGRIMDRLIGKGGSSATAQNLANEGLAPEVEDLRTITDDELILVSRVVYATKTVNIPAVTNSIDLEAGRRSRAVTERSVGATVASTAAIEMLRTATERWSRRLALLTLGIFALTVVLAAIAVGQRWV